MTPSKHIYKKLVAFAFLLFIIVFEVTHFSHAVDVDANIIHKAKKSVVSIRTNALHSAHGNVGEYEGTGFIIDKDNGIIVTNRHVILPASVATYEITFNEGLKKDAKLLYYSQWTDIAFLKLKPSDIPPDALPLKIDEVPPKVDQSVFILGKNSGEDFSLQTGTISNLYDENEYLCSQAFRISLNVQGGASGSPVLDYKGNVIAIVNSANKRTTAWAIPISYVSDIYKNFLKIDATPTEHTIGVFFKYYPIDYATKYANFPKEIAKEYKTQYPDSFNRTLRVEHILHDTPAAKVLQLGDIVWSINGISIGPNLYKLHHEISKSKKINLQVYRNNKLLNIKVPTYNAEDNKTNRLVYFGGGIFYEADELTRFLSSIPTKALMISNISSSSCFTRIINAPRLPYHSTSIFITPASMGNYSVNNLNTLIAAIPQLLKNNNKYFTIRYNDYGMKITKLSLLSFNDNQMIQDIEYNPLDNNPKLFWFDKEKLEWQSKSIDH